MSAEPNISPQDYELLSAYIDGELTASEQRVVESRLATNPILQQELNSLRATVNLIHVLPSMTAPRDFTLTAEMLTPANVVQLRPRRSAYLSLVASVVLMLFGAIFMFSEIAQESSSNGFAGDVANSAPPANVIEDVANQQTDVMTEPEAQAERALSEPNTTADDVVADETITDIQALDIVSDGGEGNADLALQTTTIGEVAEMDADQAEDAGLFSIEAEESMSAETQAEVLDSEVDQDLADDMPDPPLAGASIAEEPAVMQSTLSEATEAVVAESQTTADKTTEPDVNDSTEERDRIQAPAPPASLPPESAEPQLAISGVEIGIGLLSLGGLMLLLSLALFRRNRS